MKSFLNFYVFITLKKKTKYKKKMFIETFMKIKLKKQLIANILKLLMKSWNKMINIFISICGLDVR